MATDIPEAFTKSVSILVKTVEEFVGGKRMVNNDALDKSIMDWLNGQVADFYDEINQLLQCFNKCFNLHEDYI